MLRYTFPLLCFALLSGLAFSQNTNPNRASIVSGGRADASNPVVSLDFPGGELRELLDELEKAVGEPVNAVFLTDADNLTMPRIRVQGVTVGQVLSLTEGERTETYEDDDGRVFSREVRYRWRPFYGGPKPIWYLESDESVTRQIDGPEPRRVRPISVANLLDDYSIDEITTAIAGAWELAEIESEDNIRYHEETGLLLIAGTPQQIELAILVVQQLGNPGQMAMPMPNPTPVPVVPNVPGIHFEPGHFERLHGLGSRINEQMNADLQQHLRELNERLADRQWNRAEYERDRQLEALERQVHELRQQFERIQRERNRLAEQLEQERDD